MVCPVLLDFVSDINATSGRRKHSSSVSQPTAALCDAGNHAEYSERVRALAARNARAAQQASLSLWPAEADHGTAYVSEPPSSSSLPRNHQWDDWAGDGPPPAPVLDLLVY